MRALLLGAGPAGLAAALALAERGERPIVYEKARTPGGICRTVERNGYYFDIGGHRFFTKFDEVQALWERVLGEDFLRRARKSRILYDGDLFDYPLRASNALRNLGPIEAARCMGSYARARFRPRGDEKTFEDWVSNRFGDRLFDIFFRTYTEKVWGIPTDQIGAEWASQRIKNLELSKAVKRALLGSLGPVGRRLDKEVLTSLIEEFHYPRLGPGQMYDAMADRVRAEGGDIRYQHEVVRLQHDGQRVLSVTTRDADGREHTEPADQVLSTVPLTRLVQMMDAPADVIASSKALNYRHLAVAFLIVDRPELFDDTWIYVHDKRLDVGRIQNFANWSPHMVPDPNTTSFGLEYFCSDGDPIWTMSEDEHVAHAMRELAATGLAKGAQVKWGWRLKVPRAYPVYSMGYKPHLERITAWVRRFDNLHPMGRYGMFKYNNSDHSILTALLTVENLFGARHDVWQVNADSDYHEIRRDSEDR